jgi:hypothetical protein
VIFVRNFIKIKTQIPEHIYVIFAEQTPQQHFEGTHMSVSGKIKLT